MGKLDRITSALAQIAGRTGQLKVFPTIGATTSARLDVVDVPIRAKGRTAIGAPAALSLHQPLVESLFAADFPTPPIGPHLVAVCHFPAADITALSIGIRYTPSPLKLTTAISRGKSAGRTLSLARGAAYLTSNRTLFCGRGRLSALVIPLLRSDTLAIFRPIASILGKRLLGV